MRWLWLFVPAGIAFAAACSDSKGLVEVSSEAAVAEVQVTPATGQLYVGGTLQLAAVPRDDKGRPVPRAIVYWTSSDESVARVGRTGTVRALAEGTVTVTARAQGITGSAVLTVLVDPSRRVAVVRIVPDSFTLVVGGWTTLTALVLDSAGRSAGALVGWSSSDPAVASITSEGRITGVAEGSATITAVAHGIHGTAHVTVRPGGGDLGPGTPFAAFGLQWTLTQPLAAALFYDVWGRSPNDVLAVGTTRLWDCCGVVVRYDGSGWTELQFPEIAAELTGIWGSAAHDVFVVGGDHILHFDGTAWQEMAGAQGRYLTGVWGSSATDVYAVGGDFTLLHYDGADWSPVTLPAGQDWLMDVWGSSANDVFVVGTGTILHYDGAAWTRMASPASSGLRAVMGSSASDVFAIGVRAIYHYDGSTWSEMQRPTDQQLTGLWVNGPDDVYVIAGKDSWPACCSALLHYDGSSWSAVETTTGHALFGIWGSRDAMYIATSGGIIRGVR